MECPTCHEGKDGPKIEVTFEPAEVMPGQKLRINVTASHAMAVVGGVFVDTLGKGDLQIVPDTQTWLIGAGQGTHTEPHPYLSGQVKFVFDWVAPVEAGATRFEVWSNAANNNLMQADDSPAHVSAFIAHGCAGVWYYPDADLDGFGDESKRELSCAPIAGLMTQGGDCDDASTMIHAGIPEVCDGVDQDCDGAIDNGFMPAKLWIDGDGDGFGALGGQMKMGCPPVAGYAPTTGDCDDARADINPKVVEMPNGMDDNCDSQVDEKPGMGVGGSSGGMPPVGGSSSAGTSAGPSSGQAGGCSVPAAPSTSYAAALGLLALLLGGRYRRRRAGRRGG